MNNSRNRTVWAVVWSFVERFSTQVVSFFIGILLARLLSPHDFGVVGLISIFLVLSNVFIDSGFASALIRKVDRTQGDLSTAFYFNIVVGVVSYSILAYISPFIADYFDEPVLVDLVKIAGLNVLFNSFCIVQTAILTANLNIKLQTIINICSQIPAGLIAVYMAYQGQGVYSLAYQTVISSFLKMLLLWAYAKWRPSWIFDFSSFFYLWNFGSKLLAATLVGTFFDQVYSVLIGKYIGKNELGYFSKAQGLNNNVNSINTGIIQKVALPVLSRYQNNCIVLSEKFREVMCMLIFIIAPLSSFLFFASDDIIITIWTEKWLQSSILFKFLILSTMFSPIGQLSLSLLQVIQRTDLILKLEFPKKFLYCIYIAIGFQFGVLGLVVAMVFISITAMAINMWATKIHLIYSFRRQTMDLLKYMLLSFFLAWICSSICLFTSHIINIVVLFLLFSSAYLTTLYFINDHFVRMYLPGICTYFKVKNRI